MLMSNFTLRDYMRPMLAKSYDSEGAEFPFLYMRGEPSGSFISNAKEMSRFMRMILNGGKLCGRQILKKETLEKMFVQQNSNIEFDFPNDHGRKWGLSWMLSNSYLAYAGKYVGHGGDIPHYHTRLHILPEHGLAVVVETNSERGAGLSIAVAGTAMIKALEIFKGIQPPDPAPLPPIVPLTQEHIKQTVGTYATNKFGILSISPDNNRLFAESPEFGDSKIELKPHQDGWFSLYLNDQPFSAPDPEYAEYENARITVKNGTQGRFMGIQYYDDESGAIFSQPFGCEYQVPEEIPPNWINRVGAYHIINPDGDISDDETISIEVLPPGVLTFDGLVLDPIFDDQAVKMGLGRGFNDTVQVVDCDGDECLYYRGYLFKKQSD